MRSIYVYAGIFGFAMGVVWQDIFELGTEFWILLSMLIMSIWILLKHNQCNIKKTYARFFDTPIIGVCVYVGVCAFILGTVRMSLAQDATQRVAHIYDAQLGAQVELRGVIKDEPDTREYAKNIIVQIMDCDNCEISDTASRVFMLIKARPYQKFAYGDEVMIFGKLEKPKNFTGDTGREFDYVGYLAKDGLHYMMKYPNIEIISRDNGNKIKAILFAIKQRYIDTLGELIPEPQAGLAAGITVGAKRALGKELMEAFRSTGLIHIVVLSGFNVTIIILFLLRVFAWLPRWVGWSLASLAVVLFAILTGADAPVVRASAMGLLGVLALTLGRTYDITRALFLVALGMIIWNPYILLHDIAFQLSVIATLGLIFLAPKIIQSLSHNGTPELRSHKFMQTEGGLPSLVQSVKEIISITIAAQIAVLPLLIYYMGEVSVVAVAVNVLTLPIIPIAMLTAFIAGTIGMLSVNAALPFAYATYALLSYILWIVEFFNALPITTLQIF